MGQKSQKRFKKIKSEQFQKKNKEKASLSTPNKDF